ncbi:MAG: hypothetical protein U0640_13750 [Phycisphaerales bacterium]
MPINTNAPLARNASRHESNSHSRSTPQTNSLPSSIKSRRLILVLLPLAILAFLYCLYFTLFYGWLTATPDAQRSNAVQRFYIYLTASGITLALVVANIVALIKRL